MIDAQSITLRRGTKVLLDGAQFTIHPGECVGVVGKNGAGKSSLFALLKGVIDLDQGQLSMPPSWRISSVEQEITDPHRSALEFVIDGHKTLRQLEHDRQTALDKDCHESLLHAEAALEEIAAWKAPTIAQQLLSGLGFSADTWHNPVRTFSGGWQMRLALARALMAPSDLLLLDEPTNHLDLDAMIWLERWLNQYPGTILIISHDSEFLNSACQHILSFEQQKLYQYKGNFDQYLEQKALRLEQHEAAIQQQQQQIAKLQSFITRFKAKASKAKQAQSRVKALERMQLLAPIYQESGIQIHLVSPKHTPDPLLTLEHLHIGYHQPLVRDINVMVRAGARIGVLGANGAGKSTLIKTLVGQLPPLGGTLHTAKGVKIGYFAQHQLDLLDPTSTPLQHMQRQAPDATEQQLRNYLGRFGFYGDMAIQPVAPLSGGERARLALAMIVWEEPNLLVLDEPSNHLDMDTREALANALTEFEGSLLMVSHDRHLLRSTVDQFWIIHQGQFLEFDGDLEDYRQWLNQQLQTGTNTTKTTSSQDRKQQKREAAQERQRLSALRKPLQQKITQYEKTIAQHTATIAQLNEQLADEGLYSDARRDERLQLLAQHQTLSQELAEAEEQWLILQTELEALG